MYEVMFKQTRGKYTRQVLAEELGCRKEFGCGGALSFAAIAFFSSVQISLGIHHHPIMTYTSSGRCVCVGGGGGGGGGVYFHCFLAKLSGRLTIH